jgi:predicted porin
MQKKILAVAVAGALASPLAFAQSSVTIYGTFDLSLHNYRVSSGDANASRSAWDVYNQSTRIGFRGEENLGGGLRAWFQNENGIYSDGRVNNPTAGHFGSRNTGVGLTGGWGTVMMGIWDSPYKVSILGITGMAAVGGLPGLNGPIIGNGDTTGTNPNANCVNISNAPATSFCGQAESSAAPFHRRLSNTVQYWSPKFGGFDFRFAFTANEEKSTNGPGQNGFGTGTINSNPSLWAVNGTYSAGPWYGTIAYQRMKGYGDASAAGTGVGAKDTGWLLGGGYNFGVAAINIGYERLKYGNASASWLSATGFNRRAWTIAASVPMGPAGSALRIGYGRSELRNCAVNSTPASGCGNGGSRALTLGYGYALSKRSTAYVQYGSYTNESGSAQNWNAAPNGPNGFSGAISSGADTRTLGVGMIHTF